MFTATPTTTKWLLECRLSMSLASSSLGRISFKFGIHEFIHHRSVVGEHKHSIKKSPSDGTTKHKIAIFLENGGTEFDQISIIYRQRT
jgi:hypothetical protein